MQRDNLHLSASTAGDCCGRPSLSLRGDCPSNLIGALLWVSHILDPGQTGDWPPPSQVPATKPAHCFFSLTAGPRPALLRLAPALDPISLASHFTFETSSCKSFVVFPSPLSLRFNSILLSWDEATKQRELLFSFCQQTTNTKKVRYVFELLSTRHHNHPHMIIALLHTTSHLCMPSLPAHSLVKESASIP
jgi:hypothetical protein